MKTIAAEREVPITQTGKSKVGYFRWVVCALLFFAATINYIDRQVIGLLKNTLQEQFKFSELDYAAIVFSFQLAYAVGLLLAGRVMDKLGTRKGFALALTVWSIAAVAHAAANLFPGLRVPTVLINPPSIVLLTGAAAGLALARFMLGLGEAGNFPASIKTVAEWFPKKERALATGIFNSGTNVGAVITPLVVPWITLHWGWQWAFIGTGAIGFLWLFFWLPLYRSPSEHPRLSPAELAYIRSDPPEPITPIPWLKLFPHRQTWAFTIGKFMTDPIWWLYLFWIPDFLHRNHGLNLTSIGLPIVIIYVVADIGSIGGGWLSSSLIKRGWTINRARKTAMLVCALAVVPIIFAARVSNLWLAVALVALAAAAHQGWSANLFTTTSDMFPKQAVGSVVGIGGMGGAVGGMLIALVVGEILQRTGSYVPVFIIAGATYLIALLIIHLIVPKLQAAKISE
ncbi:MAG: MFS transporter [candidate division KSB1 bacterium]|nr:MFS transporter [candidate division KSB1 bacterium]MDZ7312959.1 MFS transporter [candidate division KSB1 bacterium]